MFLLLERRDWIVGSVRVRRRRSQESKKSSGGGKLTAFVKQGAAFSGGGSTLEGVEVQRESAR